MISQYFKRRNALLPYPIQVQINVNDQNSFMILYKSIFEIILVVYQNILKVILEHGELLKSDSGNPGIEREGSSRVKKSAGR
ncbi:hypothetical protein [Nostoc sp.]|uniref:hypothetical protein n=1 Tax=Nostoc sp. TaxID=1180 RepID=UPI002FFB9B11